MTSASFGDDRARRFVQPATFRPVFRSESRLHRRAFESAWDEILQSLNTAQHHVVKLYAPACRNAWAQIPSFEMKAHDRLTDFLITGIVPNHQKRAVKVALGKEQDEDR